MHQGFFKFTSLWRTKKIWEIKICTVFFFGKNVAFLLLFLVLRHQVQSPNTILTIFNLYRDTIECQPVGYNKKNIGQSDTIKIYKQLQIIKTLLGQKANYTHIFWKLCEIYGIYTFCFCFIFFWGGAGGCMMYEYFNLTQILTLICFVLFCTTTACTIKTHKTVPVI